MAKSKSETQFVCNACGHTEHRWMGKCTGCQQWNTMLEETKATLPSSAKGFLNQSTIPSRATSITQIEKETCMRQKVGLPEFDRVLGGGLVSGSVVLLGGEPGIGKSTLLLTTAYHMAKTGLKVLYISGEESLSQTRITAERLSALHDSLFLLAETNLTVALLEVERIRPDVLIVDSVQTVFSGELDSISGSVSQIREVTGQLVFQAKSKNMATFLVGHVTKEGNIAGPKLLEHMVDTVLYFESSRSGPYRFLRAHKNRFGSTNEMGIFEMQGAGLKEVENPSEFFLSERPQEKPGSAIASAIEGTRSLLVEVQALSVQSFFGNPRRTTVGVDQTRCAILAAVLEKHAELALSGQDLFINVAGGTNLIEPAADLPVALAIASSLLNRPVLKSLVCFGEIGLSGELRSVLRADARLLEADRLNFKKAIMPKSNLKTLPALKNIEAVGAENIEEAISLSLEEFSTKQ